MPILETLFGVAAPHAIKAIAKRVFPKNGDERAQQIHEALERAYKRFFEQCDTQYGPAGESFLAQRDIFDRIMQSISYTAAPLTAANLNGEGYGAASAPLDVRAAFVALLHEEMRKVDVLDRLLLEQKRNIDTAGQRRLRRALLEPLLLHMMSRRPKRCHNAECSHA